jgi:hypothetical protein
MAAKRKPRPRRRAVDPRTTQPIAYVVDSGGEPVTHTWTPTGSGVGRKPKSRTTTIGIYRMETGLPEDEAGRHVVWLSDEDHGDIYPWPRDALPSERPVYLTRFMREARETGELSAAFRLTDWGRLLANGPENDGVGGHCACAGGRPLREASRAAASKRDGRGGMNSKEWKKHLRRLAREGGEA